ncbi:MAG: carbohydrate kinase family protein [Clostridia bacterium]|nr:carbohydrate kinase family protein [Clostridia bacterium]
MERCGIAVAGTILVDKLYEIDYYPREGELVGINGISLSAGGLVPNDSVDIKKLDPTIPVYAIGKIGRDAEGEFAAGLMARHGVDISHLTVSETEKTGFTDVMSVVGGQRSFFTFSGANSTFGYDDIPWDSLNAKIFHLGYLLLLDRVDAGDGVRILQRARDMGMITSVDMISGSAEKYASVLPCLPYVDYLIVNETEAARIVGMPEDTEIKVLAEKLRTLGVKNVIIHTPAGAVITSPDGYLEMPSFKLPDGYIRGTTGAGDAFCSGALIGIYRGEGRAQILKYATLAAAASLRSVDATGGVEGLDLLAETLGKQLS